MKKIICVFFVLICSLFFFGCENTQENELKVIIQSKSEWILSDNAFDYTDDGLIDDDDYAIYTDLIIWKSSKEARDLDGDRKIDFQDYKIYSLFLQWSKTDNYKDYNKNEESDYQDYELFTGFQVWKLTEDVFDYNGDKSITVEDYVEFFNLDKYEFCGKFKIVNFEYSENLFITKGGVDLRKIAGLIDTITFSVNIHGKIICNYTQSALDIVGNDKQYIDDAFETSKIERFSDQLAIISATYIDKDINLPVSFYLSGSNGTYSTSISVTINEINTTISFDIVYV